MHSKIDLQVIFENGISRKHPTLDHTAVDFEKAISLTGFGKFHFLIVFVCGIIFSSVGFQNGLNAYIMPSAQCDLKMTSYEKGLLNVVFLAGGIASAFFWGVLADYLGRKKVLVFSLLLDAIVTLASSFSQTFYMFAMFRFFNGFIIGAPGSIVVPYLGEFLADKYRAPCLCAIGFFWTVSWMILPAAALVIMPLSWTYETAGFIFNSWRIFVAMFSLPTLVAGLTLASMFPESPRFLFSQGREAETLDILKYMYYVSNGESKGEYPVKTIIPENKEGKNPAIILNSSESRNYQDKNSGKSLFFLLQGVGSQAKSLFTFPMITSTVLASSLFFTNMFGYYGLGLWLPEIFNRFEEHYKISNVSVTVCEIEKNVNETLMSPDPYLWKENDTTLTYFPMDHNEFCSNEEINPTVFINTFIIGASCLIGNVLSSVLAKRMGLKILIEITMFISGVSAIAIYFLRTSTENLLISCVFLTVVGSGNMMISSAICDLFPTKIRAMAVCTAIFAGRVGAVASNLTIGYFLDISCEVPIFLMGSVLLCGSLIAFLLPKKSGSEP